MSLEEDISRILGPEKVSGAPDVLAAHAGDKWYGSGGDGYTTPDGRRPA